MVYLVCKLKPILCVSSRGWRGMLLGCGERRGEELRGFALQEACSPCEDVIFTKP